MENKMSEDNEAMTPMQRCIGTKELRFAPMNRGAYNKYRGWTIPPDENPEDEGYLVKYSDSYESWSPKEAFDEAYRVDGNLNYGHAQYLLNKGKKAARAGWNGKGMFIFLVPANKYPASGNKNGTMVGIFPNDMVPYGAYIAMKTAQGNVVPWLCSQTDALAEDWIEVK